MRTECKRPPLRLSRVAFDVLASGLSSQMMAGAAAVLEQLESALQRSPADEAAVLAHLEELEVALEAEAQSLSRGAEELEVSVCS